MPIMDSTQGAFFRGVKQIFGFLFGYLQIVQLMERINSLAQRVLLVLLVRRKRAYTWLSSYREKLQLSLE